jgi:hypothetical protein
MIVRRQLGVGSSRIDCDLRRSSMAAAETTTAGVLRMMNLAEITVDPEERRSLDPEAVQSIAASFEQLGQLEPILVDQDGKLIDGWNRYAAADLLGWEQIRAEQREVSEAERRLIELAKNLERAEWSRYEKAWQLGEYKRLLEAEGKAATHGGGREKGGRIDLESAARQMAKSMKASRETVGRLLRIGQAFTREQLRVLDRADCGIVAALDLVRVPEAERPQMIRWIEEQLDAGRKDSEVIREAVERVAPPREAKEKPERTNERTGDGQQPEEPVDEWKDPEQVARRLQTRFQEPQQRIQVATRLLDSVPLSSEEEVKTFKKALNEWGRTHGWNLKFINIKEGEGQDST